MVTETRYKSKVHHWTTEEKTIIRQNYNNTSKSFRELAARLSLLSGEHITYWQVRIQVARMGLLKSSLRARVWTDEENAKLESLVGRYCPEVISDKVHHSTNAVVVQMKRLGYQLKDHHGWYTLTEASEIMGICIDTTRQWIELGKLKGTKHYPKDGCRIWHIEESDLKEFITKYCWELVGRKVDLPQIVNILVSGGL